MTLNDLIITPEPRWEPEHCPGHEPTIAAMAQVRAGWPENQPPPRCVHCGIGMLGLVCAAEESS